MDDQLPTVFVVQQDLTPGTNRWHDVAEHHSRDDAINDAQERYYRGGPDIRVVRIRRKVIW